MINNDVFVENNLKRIEKALNYAYNVRNVDTLGMIALEDRTQLTTDEVKIALELGMKRKIIALCRGGGGGTYRLMSNPLKSKSLKQSKKSIKDQRFLQFLNENA